MFTILLLCIIYISFISLGLPDSLLGSAWPSMYNLLNVPLHYAGIVSMIISAGTVVSSIFCVRVLRRFGTGLVTMTSVFITAAALIGFSFTQSFLFLCLLAVPLGLGGGAVDSALNNYVALHYKARHMSWLHCFWGIGASLGPFIMSYFLINKDSWNLGYRSIGIIQFCLVIILIISLPLWKKDVRTESSGKNDSISFKHIFTIPGVKQAVAVFFSYCSIEWIAGLWSASFLVTEKGIEPEFAAKWASLHFIGITVGRFISGFITFKLTNRQMIRMGHIIMACGIAVLVAPLNITPLAGLFLIGLGCAPIFPSMLHETPVNFGRENSQAIMGVQMGCAYIGSSVMPPIFGWFASIFSFSIFPYVIGAILIVKIFLVDSLYKKTSG